MITEVIRHLLMDMLDAAPCETLTVAMDPQGRRVLMTCDACDPADVQELGELLDEMRAADPPPES